MYEDNKHLKIISKFFPIFNNDSYTCTRVGAVGGKIKNRRDRCDSEFTTDIEIIKITSVQIINLFIINNMRSSE